MLTVHIRAIVVHRQAVVAVAFLGFGTAMPAMVFQVAPTVQEALWGIVSQTRDYCMATRAARN